MATSSDSNSKSPLVPRAAASHWVELSDRLPAAKTEQLGAWFDTQLAVLEKAQERFITGRSLLKSLRR
jgi:hypothetical protein